MQNQLRDKSMAVELNSDAMIKYVIEDAVKKAFKEEMAKKLKYALDKKWLTYIFTKCFNW